MTDTKILNAYDRLNALDSNDSKETILKAVNRAKEQIEDARNDLEDVKDSLEYLMDGYNHKTMQPMEIIQQFKLISDILGAIKGKLI